MRGLYLFAIFIFIVPSVFATPSDSRDTGPIQLTEAQMDAITAGTLIIGVSATAVATGPNAVTDTNTNTNVRGLTLRSGVMIEIGYGSGQAFACCSQNTYANVTTSYYADGNIVLARQTNNTVNTPLSSFARGTIGVISISLPATASFSKKWQ